MQCSNSSWPQCESINMIYRTISVDSFPGQVNPLLKPRGWAASQSHGDGYGERTFISLN